jgi:cell fate (sporulation/competence/biofilm development) regulator YmcA (YheA/YmcA/DUF963 family)
VTKFDQLKGELTHHPWVKKAQELKSLIESSPDLLNRYQSILSLQQALVKATHSTQTSQPSLIMAYQTALNQLMEDPLVAEYLTMIEAVNDLFQSITAIIEEAINDNIDPL